MIFKKQETKIMSEEELKELEKKINNRKKEFELRNKQIEIEKNFGKMKSIDFEKIKRWLIIGVVGIFLGIIIFKIVSKVI